MTTHNLLALEFPAIGRRLPTAGLLDAPTPLTRHELIGAALYVKHDERSGRLYGGNKVRKLDYLLADAKRRGKQSIATFGAVGSHHALATAIYARSMGFDPVCFLGHQASTEHVYETLAAHVAIGTRIVRFSGSGAAARQILFDTLRGRRARLIPTGGSSWLGTVGFINAGLELARQLETPGKELRVYVANGTTGTAGGLALGLALAGVDAEVHAIRVTSDEFASAASLRALMQKTTLRLHGIDPGFPADLAERARVVNRDEFVGRGYTHPTAASDAALEKATAFGLALESTYTAKAFAAVVADATPGQSAVFWNTFSAVPLPTVSGVTLADTGLPADFARYFPAADASSPPVSPSSED